jgi:hypothetical protein
MQVPGWYLGILAGAFVSGAAAAASFAFGPVQLGTVLALVAVSAAIAFFVMTQKTLFSSSPFVPTSTPSGSAPHRSWSCTPSAEFAEVLEKILLEMLQATEGKKLVVPMQVIQRYQNEAVDAHKSGNFTLAIRNFALAINCLMREIKK